MLHYLEAQLVEEDWRNQGRLDAYNWHPVRVRHTAAGYLGAEPHGARREIYGLGKKSSGTSS